MGFISKFVSLLGPSGVQVVIGLMFFFISLKYANSIFAWIENQTFGRRKVIMEKLEFLQLNIKPERVTYLLLASSFGTACITVLLFGLIGKWVIGLIFSLVSFWIGFKLPIFYVNRLVAQRIKEYSGQMVDALNLLSNGIRAGLSVPQALGMVVDEMPAPVSQEFAIMLQQNRIGVPLEECFENLAARVKTEDNDMFVSSVNILRETGGNLAETFDTIVGVIRERIRIQQKIDTLVAQNKFQGMTIFAMPFVIAMIYFVTDPDSVKPLFTTTLGIVLMTLVIILDFIGGYIILKICDIKV